MIGYTSPINMLPAQMKSYKQKIADGKKWGKDCMDVFEQLGLRQYYDNLAFMENYQMVNGKFMWHHYMADTSYQDMITALTREFEVPSTLRHYDIIGKVINNLTEKLAEFPDVFRVQEFYENDDTNEYARTQTDLLLKSVRASINQEIMQRMIEEGIDPTRTDFNSEEEAQQYYEQLQEIQTAMTPQQINTYMKQTWQGQAEIWGTHQLRLDKQKYNIPEMDRKEFKDMLITDRCFRHFYLTPTGYNQETWNPVNTFFHLSPDIDWVDDGDYIGRIFYLNKADIIDRYGWKMREKDIKALEILDRDFTNNLDMTGFPYKVYAPFEDFKSYSVMKNALGYDPINRLPLAGDDVSLAMSGNLPYVDRNAGYYRITEVYWKSQRKIGKVVYFNEQGILTKDIVDENFVVPRGWNEKTGNFFEGNEPNCVYWTWINEVWKGTKICFALTDTDAIYLDLEPCEFQFKGDFNIYECKLPVVGRTFNNRNAQSMSLVDFMKPHQVGHNLCMNQLYQLCEKEIGVFAVWDANFFNTLKDWGGEDGWEKVAIIAKELGHVFGDTSPAAMKGANPGSTLPKVINMELTSQMMSRARLAEFFEQRAMAQLGISPQLMADTKATETATGIQTAVSQAQLNVQRYYTDFFEYKKRCLTKNLDIAQFTQSQNRDITIMYTKSDMSREFVKILGTDLLLKNLNVYVVDSQELLRQLEQIKQIFVQNNTMGASTLDMIEVITSNSPSAIKAKLKEVIDKQQAQQERQFQQQQELAQMQQETEAMKQEREDARAAAANQTKERVAWINAYGSEDNSGNNEIADTVNPLEYSKMVNKMTADNNKIAAQRESNQIQREKQLTDKQLKERELDIKEKDQKVREKVSRDTVKVAKENKNYKDR